MLKALLKIVSSFFMPADAFDLHLLLTVCAQVSNWGSHLSVTFTQPLPL